ncbi:MAG: CheR family methyltransferase [Candidatus Cloacimonadota bacterium]|nr:CheR family methyltransferase [Candidatus Cloacimonadota bacterium]
MGFSYFFRDVYSLNIAADKLLETFAGNKEIKIWDAGCSFGAEPFTFSIILAERMGHFAFKKVKILATDIDSKFGKVLSDRIYEYKNLERIPKDYFAKYFDPTSKENYFQVSTTISDRISFQTHDLLSLKPIDTEFSLIICKNVLLHLNYQQRIKVIEMYHKALMKNGLLVMEHTQPLPVELEKYFTKLSSSSQFFQKKVLS